MEDKNKAQIAGKRSRRIVEFAPNTNNTPTAAPTPEVLNPYHHTIEPQHQPRREYASAEEQSTWRAEDLVYDDKRASADSSSDEKRMLTSDDMASSTTDSHEGTDVAMDLDTSDG